MAERRFENRYCDKCEADFYQLIDLLIKDIQHLETKVVHLRHSLSMFLPEHEGKMLRCGIFSDLSGCHCEQPAYQRYVSAYCDGNDPMYSEDFNNHMLELAKGREVADL